MRPETIENILVQIRPGTWFGFGGKEKSYETLIIHSADEKPTQEWLEAELKRQQEAWDAEQITVAEAKASAVTKLKSLGLDDSEVSAIIGGAA